MIPLIAVDHLITPVVYKPFSLLPKLLLIHLRSRISSTYQAFACSTAHQIRVQFASRKHPLAGDGKYGSRVKGSIALQSCGLQFLHPETGKPMAFTLPLPDAAPWKEFFE